MDSETRTAVAITFWNAMGESARWLGKRFEWAHLALYGLSGNFDARADTHIINHATRRA